MNKLFEVSKVNIEPYGVVAIGMRLSSFLNGKDDKFNVTVRRDENICTLQSLDSYPLHLWVIADIICGITYPELMDLYPKNMLHRSGDFIFLTDICVADRRLIFRNKSKLDLCEVAGSSKTGGSYKNRVSKAQSAQPSGDNLSSIKKRIKELDNIIEDLRSKFWREQNYLEKCRSVLEGRERAYKDTVKAHEVAVRALANSYVKGFSQYTLKDLISLGKLCQNELGVYVLVSGSCTPTVKVQECAYEYIYGIYKTEMRYGDRIIREFTGDGFFSPTVDVARPVIRNKGYEDEAYKAAYNWVMNRNSALEQDVVDAFKNMYTMRRCYEKALNDCQMYESTLEYRNHQALYDKYRTEFDERTKERAELYDRSLHL